MYNIDQNEAMNICMSPEGGQGSAIMGTVEKPVLLVEVGSIEPANYFGEGLGVKADSLF